MERSGRPKNRRKKGTYVRTIALAKHIKTTKKGAPKGLQMGDLISGVAPLWRLLGAFGAPNIFLTPKMNPRRPQSDPRDRKSPQNSPQRSKTYSKSAPESEFVAVAGGLREALK